MHLQVMTRNVSRIRMWGEGGSNKCKKARDKGQIVIIYVHINIEKLIIFGNLEGFGII